MKCRQTYAPFGASGDPIGTFALVCCVITIFVTGCSGARGPNQSWGEDHLSRAVGRRILIKCAGLEHHSRERPVRTGAAISVGGSVTPIPRPVLPVVGRSLLPTP